MLTLGFSVGEKIEKTQVDESGNKFFFWTE